MPGGLVHIFVGLISAIAVHRKHFKLEYSLSIFIGNLLPDAIRHIVSAIAQGTIHVFSVREDSLFNFLDSVTNSPQNWFTVGFFVLSTSWLLYHYHFIKKKKMWEYDELYIFLLVGIITHLILDVLFTEQGIWW